MRLVLAFAALMVIAAPGMARADFLTNGGFEAPVAPNVSIGARRAS